MWLKLIRWDTKLNFGCLGLFVLGLAILCPGLGFAQQSKMVRIEVERGKWVEVDPYAPAPKTIDGWTEYDQPIPQGEPDPKHPWYPKGPFPYQPSWPRKDVPYTGQELMVFQHFAVLRPKYWDNAIYAPKMNARGLIENSLIINLIVQHFDDYNDVLTYSGKNPLHSPVLTVLNLIQTPPELNAMASLNTTFNNAPGARWKYPETFVYIPYLRKIRRVAGGGKQDDVLGYPVTYDDNGNREVWEENHEIIGEDVLCAINYDKKPLTEIEDIVKFPKYPGIWGEGLNPYREDGCVECWVVKSTHKDPKYYLSYRLNWIEKRTKTSLREEQYDREGKLFRIRETSYVLIPPYPPHMLRSGWGNALWSFWDLKRNFYAIAWNAAYITDRPITVQDLTQSRLEREYFWREPLKVREITKADNFPPYPPLYPEKVSKYRNVQSISPATMAAMKRKNIIWEKKGGIDPWKLIEYTGPRGNATPYKGGAITAN